MNPFTWYLFTSKSDSLKMAYTNSRYFRLYILTTDGFPLNIDFGDGIINSVTSNTTLSYDTLLLMTGVVKIFSPLRLRQIQALTFTNQVAVSWNFSLGAFLTSKNLLQFDFRSGNVFGNVVNLSPILQTFQILSPSNGSLTGDIANISPALTNFNQTSSNANYIHTTAQIGTLTSLTNYTVGGNSKVTGNLASLPLSIRVFSSNNTGAFLHEFTYPTISGTRAFPTLMSQFLVRCASTKGLTSAMIDALLIDLSNATSWISSGAFIRILSTEGNGVRTSASDSAINFLTTVRNVTLTLS